MNNKIIKKIIVALAIFSIFTIFTSCPTSPEKKEDPSVVTEPQAPVYLLLLEQEDATETATKALYYDSSLNKWGRSYDRTRGVYNELATNEAIEVPKKNVQVSFDIPYKSDSKGFDYKEVSSAAFKGYYSSSDNAGNTEREIINYEGLLSESFRDEGISERTVVKAKFESASINLDSVNSKVNEYIRNLGKDETVDYWTDNDGNKYFAGDQYETDKKTSKLTLTTTSDNARLDFNLNENTNSEATKTVYYSDGKWYFDLSFKVQTSSVVPPKKEHRVSFNVNPDGIEPLLSEVSPQDALSVYEFNGYKDGDETVVSKEGKIRDDFTLGEKETKTLQPSFSDSGTGVDLSALPYVKNVTVKKGYMFKGWKTSVGASDVISDDIYYPTAKDNVLYGVWEPVVYTLDLNSDPDENISSLKHAKIYYWQDHGWYENATGLKEQSQKLTKIDIPLKEWVLLIDDAKSGIVIEKVIDTTSGYKGLQKDVKTGLYFYTYKWIFDGYSVGGQKFIDKNGNILSDSYVRLSENKKAEWKWIDIDETSKPLLPRITDMNEAAVKIQIAKTFDSWRVNNGTELIPLSDNIRLSPENRFIYTGSDKIIPDKPEIRVQSLWQIKNGGTLTLLVGDSTEFVSREIYSVINTVGESGAWYSDSEGNNPIESISPIPKKKWTVSFNPSNGGDVIKRDYSFKFEGFVNGIKYINENGKIVANPIQTNISASPQFTLIDTNGVEFPSSDIVKRDGYKLIGWSSIPGAAIPEYEQNEKYFVPEQNNTVLYAVWEAVINTITFTSSATNSNWTKSIYSRYENDVVKYYMDEQCTVEYNPSEFIKPERKYIISFSNTMGCSVPSISVSYAFDGYKTIPFGSEEAESFMNENGVIVYTDNTSRSMACEAILSRLETEIQLPSNPDPDGSVTGYSFAYWSKSRDGEEFIPDVFKSDLTLWGVWKAKTFTLNLDITGAIDSENATQVLYYLYEKGWYLQKGDDGSVVESSRLGVQNPIVLPKKMLSVKYNKNTQEEVTVNPSGLFDEEYKDEREFKFKSYNDNFGAIYVRDDSSIIDKIDRDVNAHVEWQNVDPIDVNKYTVKYVREDANMNFVGWSEESESEKVYVNQYAPPATVGSEVTLYAKWQRSDLYKLTLSDSGATESGQLSIYYQPPVSTEKGIWYSDSDGETPLVDNTLSVLPKKSLKVILVDTDENGSDIEEEAVSSYVFEGYVLSTSSSGDVEISASGKIKENSYITSHATAEARWSDKPKSIKLGTKVKPGYIFKGWSLKRGGDVIGQDEFVPETDGVRLYAIWESEVYSLDLFNAIDFDDEGATKYKTLYYKFNVGWYNDKLCSDPVSGSITLPKSTFTVSFDVDRTKHPNVANPESKEVYRLFNGYYFKGEGSYYSSPIINKDGVVVDKISGNLRAYSQWDYSSVPVNLPSGYNDPGWSFKGWTTGNNQIYTTVFNPTGDTRLNAVWQANTYTLRLIHNSATDLNGVPDTINYVTGDGWYNLDGNKIVSVKIPKKEYIVRYSTLTSDPINYDPDVSAFVFAGYYLNGNKCFINEDGMIRPDVKLTGNVSVNAKWTQSSEQKIIPPTVLTNQREGYIFKGWSEVENSTNLIPEGEYKPQSKETTLYAVYTPYVTKLNFVLQDKDNNFITNPNEYTKTAYYRYDDAWYKDETCNIPLSSVVVPSRSIIVTLTTDDAHPVKDMQTEYLSTFPFIRYANLNGDDVYTDTDSQTGVVTIKPSKKITKETTVYAFYDLQQNITLPDTDVMYCQGWDFSGWQSKDEVLSPGITYKPQDNITFSAIWTARKSRLTLTAEDGRNTQYSHYIYYKTGSGWFSDPDCQTQITQIQSDKLPERYYDATFDVNSSSVTPPSVESERCIYPFDGFMIGNERFTDKDGRIIDSVTIGSDSVAYALWAEPSPVALKRLEKEGSTFIGWNETGETQDGNVLIDSVVLTKDVALKAIWGEKTFVLTLKAAGATSTSHTQEVYYITEGGNKGWYIDLGSSTTESVIKPEKKYTVTFNYDMGIEDEREEYSYAFEGYYDANGKQWVNGNGAFTDGGGISKSTEAVAKWSSNTPMYINVNHKKTREGYTFKGWSEKKGDTVTLGEEYTPVSDITLYAVWESDIYTINLSSEDADNRDTLIKNLYYKVGVGWFTSVEDAKNEVNRVVTISNNLPKKTYTVNLKPGKGQADFSSTSLFNFEGYTLGEETFIGSAGVIVKESITAADNNSTISVKWSSYPSSIDLPSYSYSGYQFAGWSTNEGEDPDTAVKTAYYIPKKNNEILYGIWQANIYTLTFVASDTTSGPYDFTRNLYYKVDSGWYFDREATERKFSDTGRIVVPEKEWTVHFTTSVVLSPEDSKSTFTFAGYFDDNNAQVITAEGGLSSNYSLGITKDTVVYASWGNQTSVTLPALSSTGWTFYGWTEQDGGNKDNVLKTTQYVPRKPTTILYGVWNANIFVLNLSADDKMGVVESPYDAIYYKTGDGEGWYLTPNATGTPITKLPELPTSYFTISYDEIHINGIPTRIESQKVYRSFVSFSVNGEEYIDAEGNIRKPAITSSYNATAVWKADNTIDLFDTSEILKLPYSVFKKWVEKETGVEITSPYKPERDITIIPVYKRRYLDVYFDLPTNSNYSDYTFPVTFEYDRLWLDVVDGLWYVPYGEGQILSSQGDPIPRNNAKYKMSSYSTRIGDPYGSSWSHNGVYFPSWRLFNNADKELTKFYDGYDTDVVNVQVDLPFEALNGIGFVMSKDSDNQDTVMRLFSDNNFNLLNFNTIKANNPDFDFEEYSLLYHVCVLYSADEELRTTTVTYPKENDKKIIRQFEYDYRPECVVYNTKKPSSYADRRLYERDYNAYCARYQKYDKYYFLNYGYRIIQMQVIHNNEPIFVGNEIVSLPRDANWNISMDGGGIQFKNADNNTKFTHYLLPYAYEYGKYLPADITLSDYRDTDYAIQRVKTPPTDYIQYAEGKEPSTVTYPDGTKKDLKKVTIIPYSKNKTGKNAERK